MFVCGKKNIVDRYLYVDERNWVKPGEHVFFLTLRDIYF